MNLSLINSADEHLFFSLGPFQRSMVEQFISHYSLIKYRIFDVSGTTILEKGIKVGFKDILSDIENSSSAIVYIPHVNSIFLNMLFSDKVVVLANIPDGLPNMLHIRPSLNSLLKQVVKTLYCLILYQRKFTIVFDNLVGYNFGRYSFAFSPYPELVWDKKCPVVAIPMPWQKQSSMPPIARPQKVAIIVGQPLENIMSSREKSRLVDCLCTHALKLAGVKSVYYILHPREDIKSLYLPEGVKLKRLSSPVERIVSRTHFDYCLGVSSFSLINIKLLNNTTEVFYCLSGQLSYSKELKELFNKMGMREI